MEEELLGNLRVCNEMSWYHCEISGQDSRRRQSFIKYFLTAAVLIVLVITVFISSLYIQYFLASSVERPLSVFPSRFPHSLSPVS